MCDLCFWVGVDLVLVFVGFWVVPDLLAFPLSSFHPIANTMLFTAHITTATMTQPLRDMNPAYTKHCNHTMITLQPNDDSGNVNANHTNMNNSNDNIANNSNAKGPPPLLASPASAWAVNIQAQEFHLCKVSSIEARLRV